MGSIEYPSGGFFFKDGGTLTISGGGTLVGTTTYNRYAQSGKLLIWQFKFEQTTAGSGGASVGFALPGGLTAPDRDCCGFAHVNDWLNGNETNGMSSYTSSDIVYFRTVEQGSFLDLLGAHWVGNANVNFIAASLMIELD